MIGSSNNKQPSRGHIERPLSIYDNLSAVTPGISPAASNNGKQGETIASNGTPPPFADISFRFENAPAIRDEQSTMNTSYPDNVSSKFHNNNNINNNNNNQNNNQTTNNKKLPLTGNPPDVNNSRSATYENGQEFPINLHESSASLKTPAPSQSKAPHHNHPVIVGKQIDLVDSCSNPENAIIVKPVISDAKSRFFGLSNGSDRSEIDEDYNNRLNNTENTDHSEMSFLCGNEFSETIKPAKIVPIQPHYQNIPTNSAIVRKFNGDLRSEAFVTPSPSSSSSSSASPQSIPITTTTTTISEFPVSDNNFQNRRRSREDEERSSSDHSNRGTKYLPFDSDFGGIMSQQPQPSQVVYMSTTVPQNIKGNNIAGRHTPTRNSLRHSRMLVVNKNYQGPKKPNPLGLKYPKIAKVLLVLHTVLGILITFIGVWILLWAPYTRTRDNPYWSGLALVLAGVLGLSVIQFKRIARQKLREHLFVFLKINSIIITIAACILCFAAFTCAAIHLNRLMSPHTRCTSTNILIANAACICVFGINNSSANINATDEEEGRSIRPGGYEFHYRDLSCSEVNGAWQYILIMSIVLNVLGFFVAFSYLVLLCFRKNSKITAYSSVQTNIL